MLKLALCSDIHLNFLNLHKVTKFAERVFHAGPDGVLITGDISEANVLVSHLKVLAAVIDRPIYFVLGNHDYWHGSFDSVAKDMRQLMIDEPKLKWLQASGVISLTPRTALVGVDGFYDAGYGDWQRSSIFMNDWNRTEDFRTSFVPSMYGGSGVDRGAIISVCRAKAARDADIGQALLEEAFKTHDHVIFATHVPPWLDVAKHMGNPTDPPAQPYYLCKTMGNMLEEVMAAQPDGKTLNVFCGHTHSKARARIGAKIDAYCSGADYGNPSVSEMVSVL